MSVHVDVSAFLSNIRCLRKLVSLLPGVLVPYPPCRSRLRRPRLSCLHV